MPSIDVVLSPSLWELVDAKDKNVVVIDIFRATTTICAALNYGAEKVLPVLNAEEALTYKQKGYLTAGERNGQAIPGFDFGNSPLLIQDKKLINNSLALTTTNGTKCFEMAKACSPHNLFAGAFINISALANKLIKDQKDVVLFCAGWKNQINLEDTLFAGTLINYLKNYFSWDQDSVIIALDLYKNAIKTGMTQYLQNSSHYKRLSGFGANDDMAFALQMDQMKKVVVMKQEHLVLE